MKAKKGERMNKKELLLAAKMLDMYSKSLGNNTCNDFDFPSNWTEDEKKSFVFDYHEWNGDPEEFSEKHLSLPDFAISSFLAVKLDNTEPTN